jgi:hypothetical protein
MTEFKLWCWLAWAVYCICMTGVAIYNSNTFTDIIAAIFVGLFLIGISMGLIQ